MANKRDRTLMSLNAMVDEQVLELGELKRELQNLSKKVNAKYDTIRVKLEAILKNMNQTQGLTKKNRFFKKLLTKRLPRTPHLV